MHCIEVGVVDQDIGAYCADQNLMEKFVELMGSVLVKVEGPHRGTHGITGPRMSTGGAPIRSRFTTLRVSSFSFCAISRRCCQNVNNIC